MHEHERVLILYSWDDFISKNRNRMMRESPLVKGISFEQCFAMEHEKESVSSDILVQRISGHIETYKPTVFLFHTGMAFQMNPAVFRDALVVLKNKYRDLPFGCERRRGRLHAALDDIHVFDSSPAVRDLESLIQRTSLRQFSLPLQSLAC